MEQVRKRTPDVGGNSSAGAARILITSHVRSPRSPAARSWTGHLGLCPPPLRAPPARCCNSDNRLCLRRQAVVGARTLSHLPCQHNLPPSKPTSRFDCLLEHTCVSCRNAASSCVPPSLPELTVCVPRHFRPPRPRGFVAQFSLAASIRRRTEVRPAASTCSLLTDASVCRACTTAAATHPYGIGCPERLGPAHSSHIAQFYLS